MDRQIHSRQRCKAGGFKQGNRNSRHSVYFYSTKLCSCIQWRKALRYHDNHVQLESISVCNLQYNYYFATTARQKSTRLLLRTNCLSFRFYLIGIPFISYNCISSCLSKLRGTFARFSAVRLPFPCGAAKSSTEILIQKLR